MDEIRELVKLSYGDDYYGLPISTCEAGLCFVFDTFGTPPIGGRGSRYQTVYVGLYEKHIEHHLSTRVRKFGYVFYAASFSETAAAVLILLSKIFRSFRVNFHSNGLAMCS